MATQCFTDLESMEVAQRYHLRVILVLAVRLRKLVNFNLAIFGTFLVR